MYDVERTQNNRVSLVPDSIKYLEQELRQNLNIVRRGLSKETEALREAEEYAKHWKASIDTAQRELKAVERHLSANARHTSQQLLLDATERLRNAEDEVSVARAEAERLQAIDAALTSLESRIDIQRFREDLTQQSPLSHARTALTMSMDSLEAIERDLKKWSYSITALRELRS